MNSQAESHRQDVALVRAAAAPDQANVPLEQGRHGRRQLAGGHGLVCGGAGSRLDEQRNVGERPQALGECHRGRRAVLAVEPEHCGPEVDQAACRRLGRIRPLPETDEDGDARRHGLTHLLEHRFDFREPEGLEQHGVNTLARQDRRLLGRGIRAPRGCRSD